MTDKVKVTGIVCPQCEDTVWSRHRHDMRYCKCGYCYVDGGRDYLRFGFGGENFKQPWTPPTTITLEVEQSEIPKYDPPFPFW